MFTISIYSVERNSQPYFFNKYKKNTAKTEKVPQDCNPIKHTDHISRGIHQGTKPTSADNKRPCKVLISDNGIGDTVIYRLIRK